MYLRGIAESGAGAIAANLALTIVEGVELRDGVRIATDDRPWLRLAVDAKRLAGRWIELTYASGLLDPLARPVLRCFVDGAGCDEVMPGALFGRAIWLGRIPEGATAIWISPTNQPGPFAFAVEKLRVVQRAQLLCEVFRRSPGRGWVCLWARAMGMRHLARLQIKRSLCATPLRRYESWRKLRARPFDPTSFDRPPPGAARAPHIRIVLSPKAQSPGDVLPLLAQLSAQPYPHWSLALTAAMAEDELGLAPQDAARLVPLEPGGSTHTALDGLGDDDLIFACAPGDLLPDYALAALARAAGDHPEADIFYGDEDFIDARGRRAAPCLRPDWSALFFEIPGAADAPSAIRVKKLRTRAPAFDAFAPLTALAGGPDGDPGAVRHIRRVLRTRPLPGPSASPPPAASRAAPARSDGAAPRASIIVATRDRLDLLERCMRGLRGRTRLAGAEILIVDNGSVRDDTKAYLAGLARDERFRVLPAPGPFNFSLLCNEAARQARAPVLVFLNNDTEIIDEAWLDALLAHASRPDVGAVGAKLLYPDGCIQHAGIVVGIDGRAGHFERDLASDDPGYFGRLNAPHEVSAVTAACLAVEAEKFFAVGGFDAVNLPVELNDVDLCLRLGERGWKTLCAPAARLFHRESASRGASVRPDERYRDQHDYFRARWASVIRDDPHFHPALSLDSLDAQLG